MNDKPYKKKSYSKTYVITEGIKSKGTSVETFGVFRKPNKIQAGSTNMPVTSISSLSPVFSKTGKKIGDIFKDTDYTKRAGPKGFGKKSKTFSSN